MTQDNLANKRHTLAHLLAAAVRKLYPEAKPTLGPAIDNGFYYDFDFGTTVPKEEDLQKIENTMRNILPTWTAFSHEVKTADEAKAFFGNNEYKKELVEEISAKGETITFYTAGKFIDLCRGGHSENPSEEIPADSFKISRIAGAYWRGDEKNKMLTRIYGLAFNTKEELEKYEKEIADAASRDHRKIGKELGLFTFSDLVGGGLPLFTPKGTAMRKAIVEVIQTLQRDHGYEEVWIPHITKPELYKTSGHWDKFGDELFKVKGRESEFVMKPMNCPHHTQIFASEQRSYKDLPVRFMEATTCYRDEQSGELLGLSRVRCLTQDDGHAFCTPDQIKVEIKNIIDVIRKFYTALGMWKEGGFRVSLSIRDPKAPEKYLGGDEIWSKAEGVLKEIAEEEKLPYFVSEGDAAFYGPKLDFKFKDAIGREWQLATAQLDFNMPVRFGLEYTDIDGNKKNPVMIHRAIAGSLERFMSVIIEHFAGNFPLWLSPVHAYVIPVKESNYTVAQETVKFLKAEGLRVKYVESEGSFGKKVREAKDNKIPYTIIIGDKDMEAGVVTLESRDKGKIGTLTADELVALLTTEISERK